MVMKTKRGFVEAALVHIPDGKVFHTSDITTIFKTKGFSKYTPERTLITIVLRDCPNIERIDKHVWRKISDDPVSCPVSK